MQTDAQLIGQIRGGQRNAYAELVRRYQRLVRSVAIYAVRDAHLADDVTQETFLVAFESLDSLRSAAKFGPWLTGIARRQAARAVRARKRSATLATELQGDTRRGCQDHNGCLSRQSEHLLELVARLPDHERVVIGLRYFEGYAVPEIARLTDRPVGTVTKQLSRAHARLRKWFSKETNR